MKPDSLNRMEIDFEAANVRIGLATWNTYAGEGEADLDGAQKQMAAVLANAADRALVEDWLVNSSAREEPLLSRRLEIWRNCFIASAVDNAPEIYPLKNGLQHRIANFKFELDGQSIRRSELQKILRSEDKRERRRSAWRAMAPLAAANRNDLRRLIELRNGKAQELGYRDYVDLILKVQEVDESWLGRMLDELVAGARPLYSALIDSLSHEIGVSPLAPWDLAYAMRKGYQLADAYFPADKALPLLDLTAKALGFAVDSLPVRRLVRDIPFGGYAVAVQIPTDVRFLVNPAEGQGFYTTTFHEYGHSLQAALTKTTHPILKEYEWVLGAHNPAYSEGMAEVMGEFARRSDWLSSMAAVPDRELERYRNDLLPAQMVTRLFDLLFNMRLELAAYSNLSHDMPVRERDLMCEIRLLDLSPANPSLWEANTWYTSYPVYWHNYILASVIASQVHESISARFGSRASANPEVADYLGTNFYAPGNAFPWSDRIQRATGARLSSEGYLRRLIPEQS